MCTATTSNLYGMFVRPYCPMNAAASRLSRRFLRAVIPSSGHADERDRRAFTSTKTSTAPSTATMSISPSRHRQFRVMILYPRRFRNLAAALSPRRPIMSAFRLGRCIWPHLVGDACGRTPALRSAGTVPVRLLRSCPSWSCTARAAAWPCRSCRAGSTVLRA